MQPVCADLPEILSRGLRNDRCSVGFVRCRYCGLLGEADHISTTACIQALVEEVAFLSAAVARQQRDRAAQRATTAALSSLPSPAVAPTVRLHTESPERMLVEFPRLQHPPCPACRSTHTARIGDPDGAHTLYCPDCGHKWQPRTNPLPDIPKQRAG